MSSSSFLTRAMRFRGVVHCPTPAVHAHICPYGTKAAGANNLSQSHVAVKETLNRSDHHLRRYSCKGQTRRRVQNSLQIMIVQTPNSRTCRPQLVDPQPLRRSRSLVFAAVPPHRYQIQDHPQPGRCRRQQLKYTSSQPHPHSPVQVRITPALLANAVWSRHAHASMSATAWLPVTPTIRPMMTQATVSTRYPATSSLYAG